MKALIETETGGPNESLSSVLNLKPARELGDARIPWTNWGKLADSAGGQVVGDGIQKLATPCAATYVGKGKAEEFAEICRKADVDTVIFDDELTPAQSRNLERPLTAKSWIARR